MTMVLEESTRPISVREGERVTSLPAMQAVLRSMFRQAASGDTKSQRALVELAARAELERAASAREDLQFAIKYQEEAEEVIARHERQGSPPPEIYPHPDDIVFNQHTGEFRIDGPLTKEQAGAQKAIEDTAYKKLRRYFEVEAELKQDPANRKLKRELKELGPYFDYIKTQGDRRIRLEALKQGREALRAGSSEGKKQMVQKRTLKGVPDA
jgi:Family of unknown function (DUF5681)